MNTKALNLISLSIIAASMFVLVSCGGSDKKAAELTAGVTDSAPRNFNITILLDLSDRISSLKNPGQAARDTADIMAVVKTLKDHLAAKGTIDTRDRIKVVFYPNNYNSMVQEIAASLNIDFGELSPAQRRQAYETIDSVYRKNLSLLYAMASSAPVFAGSDIFNYFRHRIGDDCIAPERDFRNLLVILSDGYLYHKNACYSSANRYSYIGPDAQHVKIFRKDYNWKDKFDSGDYGFISAGNDLKKLRILALEFAPWGDNTIDFDIMSAYWAKWFDEMNIAEKHYKIIRTDIPALNKPVIATFIGGI